MGQPLEDPRLKVERAKQHISEFDREVSAFLARDPYAVVVEPDADPGYNVTVVHVREEIPKKLPAILGDVVHNLRAALDLTAVEMVRRNNGDIEDVYFPFAKMGAA